MPKLSTAVAELRTTMAGRLMPGSDGRVMRPAAAAWVALSGAASAHGAPSARCGDGRRRRSSADNHEHREAGELKRQAGPEDTERVVGETQESDTQLRQGPRRSWRRRRAAPSRANEAG
jgi:hypothetical protein